MKLLSRLGIAPHRVLVIVSVMLATVAGLGFRILNTDPVFESQVKLQMTAPQEENVSIFSQRSSINARDELTIARNNFMEVLDSAVVWSRTIKKLDLRGADANYDIDITALRDADFIYITVQARTAELAEQIANTHTTTAIEYYGEVRAKPSSAVKDFLAKELESAGEERRASELAFTQFKIDNGVANLESELSNMQVLVNQLQLERDTGTAAEYTNPQLKGLLGIIDNLRIEREKAFGRGEVAVVERYDQSIQRYTTQLAELQSSANAPSGIDEVIVRRQEELQRLAQLEPKYNELQENVKRSRQEYDLLEDKYGEAVLKENTVKAASFIQIVEPAIAPTAPVPTKLRVLLILAVAGSLGLGVMWVFLLEYIANRKAPVPLVPSQKPVNAAE